MTDRRLTALAAALVLGRIALPLVLLHPAWELHRDEFLYFAMGDHLQWWRMQFPPLLPAIARASHALLGESVWAARVPSALVGGGLLAVMLATVRALGGGGRAMVLVALAGVSGPVLVRPSVLLHPVGLDQLWCALALLGVVRAVVRDAPRWWLLTGLALGLGTLTKFSAPLYGIVLGVTALLVPATRRQLATRWPWVAVVVALAVGSASVVGQLVHGWPFFAQLAVLRAGQLRHVTAGAFLAGQPLMLGGAALPMLAGAWWALRGRHAMPGTAGDAASRHRSAAVRALGVFAVLLVAWYLVTHGKDYYAAPAYPMLVAAGGVAIAHATGAGAGAWRRRGARFLVPAVVTTMAVVLLPLGVPCLDPAAMARYAARLGAGTATNYGTTLPLPQDYADMLGWRAQVAALARAYRALPAAERARTTVGGGNYGQAGAIAFHGPALGLPYPVTSVGDFWAWGPGPHDGDPTLLVESADDHADLRALWRDLRVVDRLRDPRRTDEEQVVDVILLRGIRAPLRVLWPRLGPDWG